MFNRQKKIRHKNIIDKSSQNTLVSLYISDFAEAKTTMYV